MKKIACVEFLSAIRTSQLSQILDAKAAHSVAARSECKLEVVSVVVSAVANHAVVKTVREVVHIFASRHYLTFLLFLLLF
jgi:hypothetical protein